jgi:hypothetical protein
MAKEDSIELFAIRYSPIRYPSPYKGDLFAYNAIKEKAGRGALPSRIMLPTSGPIPKFASACGTL